jgi:predicted transcriptional regulator
VEDLNLKTQAKVFVEILDQMPDSGYIESLTQSEKDKIVHILDKTTKFYKEFEKISSAATTIA